MAKKKFYVTTAIDYPSARFHLGHAYEKICTDVIARWKRLQGFNVHFSTGTDCHGLKIERAAEKAGKTPLQFVNEISEGFRELCKVLNISYDDFIMTTEKRHEKTVIDILNKLKNKGDVYKGVYEGAYCVDCETYYTEKDLVNGKCPIHKKECEYLKEQSYFFKLSKYQNKIAEEIKNSNLIWPDKKKNEILSRLKEPLRDLSISRQKVTWGIPLPFEKNMTVFVWIEALINYLTTVDYPNKKFKDFWPAVHFIGPDIVWHHTAIWYSVLSSLGIELPKVVVHGFINLKGEKLSKSRGITVDPIDLAEKYSADSLRYFLIRNIPFGEDGDFSEKSLVERHNNELANKLGNLISRVAALAEQNGMQKCENKLHLPIEWKKMIEDGKAELEEIAEDAILDKEINLSKGSRVHLLKVEENRKINQFIFPENPRVFGEAIKLFVEKSMDNYELDKALNKIFDFIDYCNWYIQIKKPWETKDKKVLYELTDSIKTIGILLWPFIPSTSEKIAKQFGFKINYKEIKKPIKVKKIKKGEILFKKING